MNGTQDDFDEQQALKFIHEAQDKLLALYLKCDKLAGKPVGPVGQPNYCRPASMLVLYEQYKSVIKAIEIKNQHFKEITNQLSKASDYKNEFIRLSKTIEGI